MPAPEESHPRVLVAEDDDSLRRLLELQLGSGGFDIRCAADGVEALEILAEWTPHLVILDVMMPRLSGLSVCREIRARPETTEIPVILLTARCFDEDIQQVVNLGGVEYVGKPFNLALLQRNIRIRLGQLDPDAPRTVTFMEGSRR